MDRKLEITLVSIGIIIFSTLLNIYRLIIMSIVMTKLLPYTVRGTLRYLLPYEVVGDDTVRSCIV